MVKDGVKRHMKNLVLTELESCVLGVIWRQQPCSAYAVRQVFAASDTTTWSASAGTIYPAIARLERLGLVRARAIPGNARGRRDLSLTAKGAAAMRAWIACCDADVASPVADPIRTRLFFIDALEHGQQMKVIGCAERLTRDAIAIGRARVKEQKQKTTADHLASLGAVYELEARLNWLGAVRKALINHGKA